MKLLIFGASGRTGLEIVKLAIAKGHVVRAFVRDPKKIHIIHPNLEVFQGDVEDFRTVEKALEGQEAVLSALGSPNLKPNTIISDGTKFIIEAMQRHHVRRFVCESSLGVGDSKHQIGGSLGGLVFRYLFMGLYLKHVFADKEIQENHIRQSGLDWVIVRPGGLTDSPGTGICKVVMPDVQKLESTQISRADVAEFMLNQVENDEWLKKTPGLVS